MLSPVLSALQLDQRPVSIVLEVRQARLFTGSLQQAYDSDTDSEGLGSLCFAWSCHKPHVAVWSHQSMAVRGFRGCNSIESLSVQAAGLIACSKSLLLALRKSSAIQPFCILLQARVLTPTFWAATAQTR